MPVRYPNHLTNSEISFLIRTERERQDKKWGGQPGEDRITSDRGYCAVLGEEFGEVCNAVLEDDVPLLTSELVQVAAVAVAWIEQLTRGGLADNSR